MPTIEFLFLANYAEIQNGLLYASGAGWSELYRGKLPPESQPPVSHFAIAMSVLVPWEETNQAHHLTIQIEPEGEGDALSRVEMDVEVGRPPGLPSGIEQRAMVALTVNIPFPKAGNYLIVAQVSGEERQIGFRVHNESKPTFFR
jgi:hypothetical protein